MKLTKKYIKKYKKNLTQWAKTALGDSVEYSDEFLILWLEICSEDLERLLSDNKINKLPRRVYLMLLKLLARVEIKNHTLRTKCMYVNETNREFCMDVENLIIEVQEERKLIYNLITKLDIY